MPLSDLPLGRETAYPQHVDAGVLVGIDRSAARTGLGIGTTLPFRGTDEWNAFELSWLDDVARPQAAVARITIDAASRAIVESKSLKLYLGGYAMTSFASPGEVVARVRDDLSVIVDGGVAVRLDPPRDFWVPPGVCLDGLPLHVASSYDRVLDLPADTRGGKGSDTVHTRLFRSVCPITGQPDWGTLAIGYRGRLIDRSALLAYLLSFRTHAGFHEHVVERVFAAVSAVAEPTALYVAGRFLRRGGIDINPTRLAGPIDPPRWRDPRQ